MKGKGSYQLPFRLKSSALLFVECVVRSGVSEDIVKVTASAGSINTGCHGYNWGTEHY